MKNGNQYREEKSKDMTEQEKRSGKAAENGQKQDPLLEMLQAELSQEPVPERIAPEQMKERLRRSKKNAVKNRRVYRAAQGLAACLAVVLIACGSVAAYQLTRPSKEPVTEESAGEETETVELLPVLADAEAAQLIALNNQYAPLEVSNASNYDEIYQIMKSQYDYQKKMNRSEMVTDSLGPMDGSSMDGATNGVSEEASEAEVSDAAVEEKGAGDGGYSGTNIQEAGVDEADIIKTDGRFIYMVANDEKLVRVVSASGGELIACDSIGYGVYETDDETYVTVRELYVSDNVLTVIWQSSTTKYYSPEGGEITWTEYASLQDSGVYGEVNTEATVHADVYSVGEDGKLTAVGGMTQEGAYESSRKVGDIVYLFTSYYPLLVHDDGSEPEEYVPSVGGSLIDAEDIAIQDSARGEAYSYSWYMVCSSFSTSDPSATIDQAAAMTNGWYDQMYVSNEAIYFISSLNPGADSGEYREETSIIKYAYSDGYLTAQGVKNLSGLVNNSFSLHEEDGNLYVLTTQDDETNNWTPYNHLFVLDPTMEVIGCISNIAEGETIKSARFMDHMGYFVTYEQTDPLFSVDLSDPYNPVIVGELKVPGFSSYLHFIDDGLLLGVGEENTDDGFTYKLAIYDISDPTNVFEKWKLLLHSIDGLEDVAYCEAANNYKELLVDVDRKLLGFSMTQYDYGWYAIEDTVASVAEADVIYGNMEQTYLVFGYEDGEPVVKLQHKESDCGKMRGLFIGNTFYVCAWHSGYETITAFDMQDGYAQIGEATLQ